MKNHLTTRTIESLKPSATRREIRDGTVAGLYLTLQTSGAKSWAFRYRIGGRGLKLTIGKFPAIGLQAARTLASAAAVEVAGGKNPAAAKRDRQRAAETPRDVFADVAREYVAKHCRTNTRERSAAETERLLKVATAAWGGRRVSDIRRADVAKLLDSIIQRNAPIAANRTLSALQRLGNWAVERGLIDASPFTSIKPPRPETARSRILSFNEIAAAWRAFGKAGIVGEVARVLTLTGARLREVSAMEWSEIDIDSRTWVLPARRAKNGVEHVVPLAPLALEILASRRAAAPGCRFVFSVNGRKPIASVSRGKRLIDAAMQTELGATPIAWVFHDLRRSAASHMAGLGVAPHVVEAVLNHRSGVISSVARVYNRFSYAPEKRAALDLWAAELTRIVAPAAAPLALAA